MIDADALRAWCLARPGVTEEMPFGPVTTVFKVEGKLFALSVVQCSIRTVMTTQPRRAPTRAARAWRVAAR